MLPSVTILLSTYNGEKFLIEQIDSLLNQKDVEIRILIRDDGSKDKTREIISQYEVQSKHIKVFYEENIGAEESFNRLCCLALNFTSTEYYAFCDQDDVWMPEKLISAINNLSKYNKLKPNLYFSNLLMVDSALHAIRPFYSKNNINCDKDQSLVQIFSYGCTCVFNRKALEYYVESCTSQIPHDNWIYVICNYFGNVYYDHRFFIWYRQHSNNLSEHRNSGLGLLRERLFRLMKGCIVSSFQPIANHLLIKYGDRLSDRDKDFVTQVAQSKDSINSRLYLLFSKRYKSRSLMKNIGIIIRIIINRL